MILKQIDLHNYRQHKDLTVDFSGNLIAVVGRNGSGKSNFLGAIQFALTGEQPGFTKDDLLTWGEESGYVKLDFEHDGKPCSITRKIEKPSATLTVGDEKVTGVAKVKETLELLGIDKDVLRQSVFVRQTEIESCLFTDPRERELAFQKLIGLGDAAKHNKFLTDFLTAVDKPRDMSEELSRHIAAREEQIETQKRLKAQSDELGERLSKVPDDTEARKKVSLLQERIQLAKAAIASMNMADLAKAAREKFQKEHENVVLTTFPTDDIQKRMDALHMELANVQSNELGNRYRLEAKNNFDKAKAVVDGIGDVSGKIHEYEKAMDKLVQVKAHRDQAQRLASEAPAGNICPLCGSTTDHNIKEEIQRSIHRDDEMIREFEEFCAERAHFITDNQKKEQAERDMQRWKARMDELGPEVKCRSAKEVNTDIFNVRNELENMRKHNEYVKGLQFEDMRLAEAVVNTKSDLDKDLAKLPNQNVTKEQLEIVVSRINDEITSIFNNLKVYSDLKTQKASFDGAIKQIDDTIATTEAAIERIKEIQKENIVREDRLKIVEDVKNWFSYRNGPRTMTQSVMGLLTDDVNRYLGQFGSSFTVVPMSSDEGMGFRYIMTDGSFVPNPPPDITQLSGGQKIALAVSFRFAVYSMFASKLGLLVLDEPTAYLDNETISRFGDMLSKIKELAQNMNLQVLISTHESQLGPVFDQTVAIGS